MGIMEEREKEAGAEAAVTAESASRRFGEYKEIKIVREERRALPREPSREKKVNFSSLDKQRPRTRDPQYMRLPPRMRMLTGELEGPTGAHHEMEGSLSPPRAEWAKGARACGKRAPPGCGRLIETNLGLGFMDQGATVSVVAAHIAHTFPGAKVEELEEPVAVFGAEAHEDGLHAPLFTATRQMTALLTVHYSVDDKERGTTCGLHPTIKEMGIEVSFLVCDDPKFFTNLVPGAQNLTVVLGEDVEQIKGWSRFYTHYLAAATDQEHMWTHAQRVSKCNIMRGSADDFTQKFHPSANALDVKDGEELPYGPRSPFEVDRALELDLAEEPSDDRGESKIPRDLEGMVAYLEANLVKKGAIVERYMRELAAIFLRHRTVLLEPRPGGPPLECPMEPGTIPTREGLRRKIPREAWQSLNDEVEALVRHKMVVAVPMENGKIPEGLFINGLVVTVRRLEPGAPAGSVPRARMCIDPAANRNAADKLTFKTRTPSMAEHLDTTNGASILTALDMPNAYHQCRLTEEGSNLFGFALPDREGNLRLWKFSSAPFGYHSFPGQFQERMDKILRGTWGCRNGIARAWIDDAVLATSGKNGTRLEDVWGANAPTPEERVIVQDHLDLLDKALGGYAEWGHVIKLKKCELLQPEIGVCGILCNGKTRRLDPGRVDGWANLGKPERVTLQYLQHVLGVANYAAPFLPTEYQTRSEPLFALAREAGRAMSAATNSKERKAAQATPQASWTEEHDEALQWVITQVQHSQTRYVLDFTKQIHVVSDASDTGVAALLGQYDSEGLFRICYTLSKRFTTQQKTYSVGAREVYGWVLATRQWAKMLLLAPDVVFESDHHNLVTSVEDLQNIHLARWCLELSTWDGFTRHRVHRRGQPNIICDVLSRCAAGFTLHQEDESRAQRFSHILRDNYPAEERTEATNPQVRAIRAAQRRAATVAAEALRAPGTEKEEERVLERFDNPHTHSFSPFMENVLRAQEALTPQQVLNYKGHRIWQVEEVHWAGRKVLLAKGRLLVPEDPKLLKDVFHVAHDEGLHAGMGLVKERLLRAKLFIPNFINHFDKYYASCTCQHARAPGQVQGHGPLILTPRQWPLAHVYMDFASLPMTDRGGKEFVGAVIIVDAASRVCQFTAVEDKKAATAVACLKKWINHWGMPVMVHCDNGSHFTGGDFTQFLADMNIAQDPGTPYHSRGRGIVERLVKKLKNGAQRLIPQGKLDSWPVFIDELERMVNRMPHKALGGEAPFDYLIRGHRQRGERFVVKEGRVFDNWTFSLPGVQPTPQREEDLALMLDSLRAIADSCSEVTSLKEAMYSESEPFHGKVGEWVLKYVAVRENSLEPMYQGPFEITADLRGDFYSVAEVLAGDALGKPLDVHASRLIRFDRSRTSGDEEHQRKLPEGHYVVEKILQAQEGKFLVKWLGVQEPKWEHPSGLRQVLKFKQFCLENDLTLEGKPKKKPVPREKVGKVRCIVRCMHAGYGAMESV
jgi:transposase InsO family protein